PHLDLHSFPTRRSSDLFCDSKELSSVVLPAPRKPVKTVTGTRSFGFMEEVCQKPVVLQEFFARRTSPRRRFCRMRAGFCLRSRLDRKSTRLNSSHLGIS